MMDQQINIDSAPARIEVNYDELAAALDEELAQYSNLVVTPENIADAKRQATAVNKLAGDLDAKRKDAVREVSEPIRAFEQQIKTLVAKCQETRQGILDQVDKYEAQVRQQAQSLLEAKRDELRGQYGIDPEFHQSEFDDLIRIGSVTDSGKLAKAARETLDARVSEELSLQRQVAARLANLEAASYRAGLHAPLTREHVEAFLFVSDDADYEQRLQALIDTEVERQQASEAAARKRYEAEEAERRENNKCDGNHGGPPCDDPECWNDGQPAPEAAAPATTPTPESEPEPGVVVAGTVTWRITATFSVATPAAVTGDQVKAKVQKRLTEAGIPDPEYLEAIPSA